MADQRKTIVETRPKKHTALRFMLFNVSVLAGVAAGTFALGALFFFLHWVFGETGPILFAGALALVVLNIMGWQWVNK